jgi:hypothetical protein
MVVTRTADNEGAIMEQMDYWNGVSDSKNFITPFQMERSTP